MRKDRKSKAKRERMIMIASSALVMGALTLTGIYMRGRSDENVDDGYSVDFSELEDSVDDKVQEIAQNQSDSLNQVDDSLGAEAGLWADSGVEQQEEIDLADNSSLEDDLDYDPLAAGSNVIRIPGLTDGDALSEAEIPEEEDLQEEVSRLEEKEAIVEERKDEADGEDNEVEAAEDGADEHKEEDRDTSAEAVIKELAFTESQGLARPVSGEVLLHYSMDKSIYFATLDQYKYNPAVMLSAVEGDTVTVCADGKVVSIFDDAQIGHAVTLDLGNGYQATYGQLKDVQLTEGSYVNRGEVLGSVAAPTKYFSVEGANLYFQLTKDGTAIDPEVLFQ